MVGQQNGGERNFLGQPEYLSHEVFHVEREATRSLERYYCSNNS